MLENGVVAERRREKQRGGIHPKSRSSNPRNGQIHHEVHEGHEGTEE